MTKFSTIHITNIKKKKKNGEQIDIKTDYFNKYMTFTYKYINYIILTNELPVSLFRYVHISWILQHAHDKILKSKMQLKLAIHETWHLPINTCVYTYIFTYKRITST